ncbi:MAG: hypothetical protein VR64_01670 [Desulfatitalea sp. BRH_c12]|nr:MAG: hypothetical protein VR64_01670 [Desulfatitalea sp. BRH_c12]
MKPWLKWILWAAAAFLVIILLIVLASYVADEPLRAYFEEQVNRNLKGYRISLEDVDINPFGPSVVLEGVRIIQEKHPDPPVAHFPSIDAGVHWRPILRGRLVGEIGLDRPAFHIHLKQLEEETANETKVQDRGWQEAVKAIFPLEINFFTITDGELTYIDQDPERPLQVRDIAFEASNIRNIESEEGDYPSPFRFEAVLFEKGRANVQGDADFLAEPHPGVDARLNIENVPLEYFAPVLARYHITLTQGRLDASGQVAFAPSIKAAHLEKLQVSALKVDYGHSQDSESLEAKTAQKTKAAADEVSNDPEFQLRVDQLHLEGDVGFVNHAVDPTYRLFLQNMDLRVENLSNHFKEGPAEVTLAGAFMGSGQTNAKGTFRPEQNGPDFDLNVKIEGTFMPALNDLLRAYGNFDVVAGTFSLYSELQVHQDMVDGYVKPLFKDLEVYDQRQDEEKGLFRKMYEGLVGGMSDLLSRDPGDRVATRTDISGEVENPQADTWQVVLTLVQNAFFKAVLPGFDQEITRE